MLSAMTPYFATIKSGAEAEAKKLGVTLLKKCWIDDRASYRGGSNSAWLLGEP